MSNNRHWTERSSEDFLYKIAADFARSVQRTIEDDGVSQAALAAKLGVSEGRVSQVLNNPGNLTLKNIVEYARAVGRKVAIVAYDDGDAENATGPVNADIFNACWLRAGRPADFFALEANRDLSASATELVIVPMAIGKCAAYDLNRRNSAANTRQYGGTADTAVTRSDFDICVGVGNG